MAFIVTLTPFQLSETETWTAAKFNLGFNPTITVTGNFADLSDYSAVTGTSKTITAIDLSLDVLTVPTHGLATGQRVKVSNSGGSLPGGLSASLQYYARVNAGDPANKLTLHYSAAGAANDTDRVDITDTGSGTQTLTYFIYATGAPFIFDSSGSTWEKGLVSPENLPEFVGATASAPGTRGAVPQPAPSAVGKFLKGDGTWADPGASTVAAQLFLYANTI